MEPGTLRRSTLAESADAALAAYEPLAPFYDRFTAASEYGPVLDAVEAWAQAQGLAGRRLLDVACGTGKSFEPFAARGYDVTACDLSPAMVAEARRKGTGAEVVVADMRTLPWSAEFDLLTCMDDAVNYLLTEDDLRAAVASMARALRPDGIAIFDSNTIGTYRTDFAESFEVTEGHTHFAWSGECGPDAVPGTLASATMTIAAPEGPTRIRHVQRHWPVAALREACLAAGFRHVVFRGLAEGPRLAGEPDEERHLKVVCLAARPDPAARDSNANPARPRERGIS
jgi:SAM-dependent methyltransferase